MTDVMTDVIADVMADALADTLADVITYTIADAMGLMQWLRNSACLHAVLLL